MMKRSYPELHSLSIFGMPSVDKMWLRLILCVDGDLTRSLDIESPISNRALEALTTWASMIMPKGNVWPAVHCVKKTNVVALVTEQLELQPDSSNSQGGS